MTTRFLDRKLSLAATRKTVTVDVPEFGCSVILRELSAGQLRNMANDIINQLALSIVDESGARIYTTPEDIAELNEMSQQVATRLSKSLLALNGVTQAAVDEALKNSLASLNADSVTV